MIAVLHCLPGAVIMVICPVAIAVGCKKCPIFKVCPVKSVIGDYKPPVEAAAAPQRTATKAKVSPAKSRTAKARGRWT